MCQSSVSCPNSDGGYSRGCTVVLTRTALTNGFKVTVFSDAPQIISSRSRTLIALRVKFFNIEN